MTWHFSVNNFPTTHGQTVYILKECLKSAGWVVKSSSDGLSYNSTGDQISGFASGAGGMSNNNAWFRIQSPDGQREFLFHRGSSSSILQIYYSVTGGFVNGTPNATTPPTATDSVTVWGNTSFLHTEGAYGWHVAADDSDGYGFYAFGLVRGGDTSTTGRVTASGGLLFEPMAAGTYHYLDADPYLIYAGQSVSNGLFKATVHFAETANGTGDRMRGWMGYGMTGGAFVTISALTYESTSYTVFPGSGGTNCHNLLTDSLPILWARPPSASVPTGFKGISQNARYVGIGRSSGETLTLNTGRDRIIVGDLILPWNGTICRI